MYSQTGLGYNIIRMMVYTDKTDWENDIEVAKKAQSLGAIVFASPRYPPANMTGTRKSAFDATQTKYLLPEYYKDYAAHLKEFVGYISSKGLNLYAISIQNEPDMNWRSFTPEEIFNFVKTDGRQLGNVKTIAAESFHFSWEYTDPLLNSPKTINNFDIVGGHLRIYLKHYVLSTCRMMKINNIMLNNRSKILIVMSLFAIKLFTQA